MKIEAYTNEGNQVPLTIDRFPDECPRCRKGCTPKLNLAFMDKPFYQNIQVVYQCPRIGCFSFFIARYGSTGGSIGVPPRVDLPCLLRSVKAIQHVAKREFSENVAKVSPDFCQIFWEAETADGNGLSLICGVGYRKSLEFLIKDFLVNHILKDRTEDQEKVKEGFLGWCISTYIDEVRIKKVA